MPNVEDIAAAIRAKDVEAVQRILAEDPSLAHSRGPDGASMLLVAAYHGAAEVCGLLMSRGVRPNVWEASALGRVDLVRQDVGARPDLVRAYSHDGWTPLHLAAHFGQQGVGVFLLSKGADVHQRSLNALANTPLHAAVAGRQSGMVATLLAHKAEVDATYQGVTALWAAARGGDEASVRLLLSAGASLRFQDKEGRTPLAIAREHGHDRVARFLAAREASA